MSDLTTIVLTKNEESNIIDVIKNAQIVSDSVLVVDSGSTDKTVELAEQAGAKVVFRAWDNDFSAQRNFALEHVATEWVLYLDADERLNDELIEAIKKALASNEDKQYSIKRKSVAFGKEFNYGVLKPDFVPRLFKTSHVKWVNKVHEKPVCEDKLLVLSGYIRHYTYPDWKHYFNKFNQYTTIWAENAYENGKRVGFISAYLHAFFSFLQMLILKKGILDGWLGCTLCTYHFMYTLTKYIKLIDLQRGKQK
ncbi:MAG: glycosyltransferase family 2 protein [Phascolarctobacterium sp.]|nr:glycosyltransferase family 2 protein [Phascolarctobacterium sp.]